MPTQVMKAFSRNIELEKHSLQKPSYIPVIAEIGINHNGDLDIAKQLIKMASDAGCDAVKFQKRDIETVYSPEVLDAPRESPWGSTQRDQKAGLEFGKTDYDAIDSYCSELGLAWTASAWDLKSLSFVESYDPLFHKVASAFITNLEFLGAVAKTGRPTILSTGMAEIEDVDKAVEIFKSHKVDLVLMHTVSTYPTPEEDLNLSLIGKLQARYGVSVGYSGHEPSVSPSIAAMALGAVVVERHITLDRTMYGSDQSASVEENGLRSLVSAARKVPKLWGDGEKKYAPGEKEVAAKLRYWQ